jgi:hypothetical protein
MTLAFTDEQMTMVTDAAALLPVHARSNFLRSIANMLDGDGDSASDQRPA